MYFHRIDEGKEYIARGALSIAIIKFFEYNDIQIKLVDAEPVYGNATIVDPKKEMSLIMSWEVNWMGEDTGKTIKYFLSNSISGALKDYMSRIKQGNF